MQKSVFVQNRKKKEMEIFLFCVITFEPIIIQTCSAPKNDPQNFSFVKDIHTYGKKMARNGRTKDIYKGTFICIQTLLHSDLFSRHHLTFIVLFFLSKLSGSQKIGSYKFTTFNLEILEKPCQDLKAKGYFFIAI